MSGYHQSYYTQAVGQMPEAAIGQGSYYQQHPEQLTYPNEAGSPQYSGYGDVSSHDMFPYGQDETLMLTPPEAPPAPPNGMPDNGIVPDNGYQRASIWTNVATLLSLTGAASGAYHGYKRTGKVGWAIGWFFFGGILPVLSIPISVAQGFGKRKVGR